MCAQAIAEAGTGQGTYGRYQLVQAPAVGRSGPRWWSAPRGWTVSSAAPATTSCAASTATTPSKRVPGTTCSTAVPVTTPCRPVRATTTRRGGRVRPVAGDSGNDILRNGEVNNGGSGRNQINPPPVATSTQTFHYGADGTLVNDTTADASTGPTATTASYLLTAGREARTLQPGTSGVGTVPARAPAPVTSGVGTGYLLRDRHSSVTALIDANAAVTDTYHYSDYGHARRARRATRPRRRCRSGWADQPVPIQRGRPEQLDDRPHHRAPAVTGTQLRPHPGPLHQPRHRQRLQQVPRVLHQPDHQRRPHRPHLPEDLFIDIGMALVFAVVAVASAGAALPAIAAAEVGTLTTTAIVTTVAEAFTAAAAATGFVASTVKAANDGDQVVNGKHFLSTDQRNALSTVQEVAGAVAAVSGLASVGAASAGATAGDATQDAAEFLPETTGAGDDGGGAITDAADDDDAATDYKRKAVVEGETDNMGYQLPSKTDDVIKGVSSHASEPAPLQQDPTEVISSEQNVLHDVLGSARLNGTEKALLNDNLALATSPQLRRHVRIPAQLLVPGGQPADPDCDERNWARGGPGVRRRGHPSSRTLCSFAGRTPRA